MVPLEEIRRDWGLPGVSKNFCISSFLLPKTLFNIFLGRTEQFTPEHKSVHHLISEYTRRTHQDAWELFVTKSMGAPCLHLSSAIAGLQCFIRYWYLFHFYCFLTLYGKAVWRFTPPSLYTFFICCSCFTSPRKMYLFQHYRPLSLNTQYFHWGHLPWSSGPI